MYAHPYCLLSSADSIAFFKAALIIDSQAFFYFKPTPFWWSSSLQGLTPKYVQQRGKHAVVLGKAGLLGWLHQQKRMYLELITDIMMGSCKWALVLGNGYQSWLQTGSSMHWLMMACEAVSSTWCSISKASLGSLNCTAGSSIDTPVIQVL